MKEFIYLDIRGITSSFKVPQVYQGFLISLPTPPYSTILGILSRLCGREITPEDTNIGYTYIFEGNGKDLEKYHRWKRTEKGKYTYVKTAVRSREVHYRPRLQIVLDNISLMEEIKKLSQVITLGRSQDVAWIEDLKIVTGKPIEKGVLSNTLVKLEDLGNNLITGSLYNIPEFYDYSKSYVRSPMNITRYLAVADNEVIAEIPNLYQIEDSIFYLYNWSN